MEEGEDEKKKEEGKPQAPIHKLKGKETKEDAREKKGKKVGQSGFDSSNQVIIQPLDKTFRSAIVVVGEVLVKLFDKIVGSRKTCESVKTCLSLKSQTPELLRIKLIVRKTPSP